MAELMGKVAIVTGAGGGIGRYEALALAVRGAAVVVNDLGGDRLGNRHAGPADEVVEAIRACGGRAVANHADISAWATGAELLHLALTEFGRVDIVVSNAGVARRAFITELTEADLDLQVGVLLKGSVGLVHHAAVHWRREVSAGNREHRTIVVTSSSAGVPGGVVESSVYGALKAALATFTLSAALEFRPFGVTVNTVLPHAATLMDATFKGLPLPGLFAADDPDPMNPHHVADVVAYLASPQAAWLSGQTLEITGTNVRRWVPWSPAGEVESEARWTSDSLDDALATQLYGTLPAGRVISRR